MKTLRHALLIVLMLLLPLRGAVAAAMLCPLAEPAQGSVQPAEPAIGPAAGPMAAAHEMHAGLAHEAMQLAQAAHDDHDGHDGHAGQPGHGAGSDPAAGEHGKCHLCTSCCTATPMVGTGLPLLAAPSDIAVTFPALEAPAPSFIVTGPERPPRTA